MKVIDVSNSLDYSGFAIKRLKRAKDTVLKAVGQGVILKILEANSEWVTFEASLEVKLAVKMALRLKKLTKSARKALTLWNGS